MGSGLPRRPRGARNSDRHTPRPCPATAHSRGPTRGATAGGPARGRTRRVRLVARPVRRHASGVRRRLPRRRFLLAGGTAGSPTRLCRRCHRRGAARLHGTPDMAPYCWARRHVDSWRRRRAQDFRLDGGLPRLDDAVRIRGGATSICASLFVVCGPGEAAHRDRLRPCLGDRDRCFAVTDPDRPTDRARQHHLELSSSHSWPVNRDVGGSSWVAAGLDTGVRWRPVWTVPTGMTWPNQRL